MTLFNRALSGLTSALRRFGRNEAGFMMAETVITLPMLVWAYMGLYVYWDAYRSVTIVQKAAYTVSDMISRQRAAIDSDYIDGLGTVLEYLVDDDQDVSSRVTSVFWNETDNMFEVHWSRTEGNLYDELSTATLQAYADMIPAMAGGDYAIIVEVDVPYTASFYVGLETDGFHQFIVTRPRFLRCIPMDAITCPVS